MQVLAQNLFILTKRKRKSHELIYSECFLPQITTISSKGSFSYLSHNDYFFFKAQRLPASFIDQIYLGNDQLILRKVLVIIGEELSSGFYSLFGVQTGISTMLNL